MSSYRVIFDSTIGSSVLPSTLDPGSRVVRPPDPYSKGYTFVGWFIGNTAYDFTQPVTSNLTLTARWAKGLNSWSLSPSHGPAAGNTTATLTPPAIGDIRFSQFSAGKDFSIAIDSVGTLYSWGNNSEGQLGRIPSASEPADRPGRVDVPDGTRFIQVSAGDEYVVAIDITNHLYSWGSNEKGQSGLGPIHSSSSVPNQVVPAVNSSKSFVQVSAGPNYALATCSDGIMYSWGDNSSGQLGRDTTGKGGDSTYPNPVPLPKGVKITQVTAGGKASLALASDGSVYSWGDNSNGQLGRTPNASEPANQPYRMNTADGMSFSQVSAGYRHTLAIDSDGNAYSWGYGSTSQPSKVTLPDGVKTRHVSAGYDYSLATGSDGNIYSWGDNSSGQLGRDTGGETTNQPDKANMPDGITYTQFSAGYRHILAMGSDGYLYGWGDDSSGQLGAGNTSSVPVITPNKADFPQAFTFISAKLDGTPITDLTRNQNGTLSFRTPAHEKGQVEVTVAWARNGHQPDAHLPYKYDGSTYSVAFDSAGGTPTPDTQRVMDGDQAARPDKDPAKDGYLFDGWFLKDSKGDSNIAYDFNQPVTDDITLAAHFSPVSHWTIYKKEGPQTGGQSIKLTPPQGTRGIRFSWIQSGDDFSLALGSDGNLYSWGINYDYQLGHTTSDKPVMVETPAGVRYTQAAAGQKFALALGSDGYVYTWGNNTYEQLGRYTFGNDHNAPDKVAPPAGIRYTRVYAGDRFALALGSDGNLYAWGDDQGGALGQGKSVFKNRAPLRVAAPEGVTFTQVFTGPFKQACPRPGLRRQPLQLGIQRFVPTGPPTYYDN
ncbi:MULTISPECIES: InlB B-repeat-containing protein [Bifidobacterium]|uniref:RCC1 domain-containing protein n=1 Tax=Bifidobacterium TaxID=1678 RepID=UPI001642A1E0|nr:MULTISPECIES: InlB B-repeat-containing protein [Bifidobacterium]MBI0071909.1 InlB B-repeat-containing protein [Bifidobacterium sp. W8112]MBI0124885.1 InlB B-repeat-containing protein [Bifidobacterium apousia]MBI0136576.1 InlB B-repeat-containing protein [Bifidobacterium sp. W8120]